MIVVETVYVNTVKEKHIVKNVGLVIYSVFTILLSIDVKIVMGLIYVYIINANQRVRNVKVHKFVNIIKEKITVSYVKVIKYVFIINKNIFVLIVMVRKHVNIKSGENIVNYVMGKTFVNHRGVKLL